MWYAACFCIGIAVGTWLQYGAMLFGEYQTKVARWKQRAEWFDEDQRKKREGK